MPRHYSPYEKPDYQLVENVIVLRSGQSRSTGPIAFGTSYDHKLDNFATFIEEGKIKLEDCGDRFHYTDTPNNVYEFNIKDDIIMVPVFSFGANNLFIPVKGDEYFKYHQGIVYYRTGFSKRAVTDPVTKPRYRYSFETEDHDRYDQTIMCSVGKVTGDAPIEPGVNSKETPGLYFSPYSEGTFRSLTCIYALQQLTNELNKHYDETNQDASAFFDILSINIPYDDFYDEEDDPGDGAYSDRLRAAIKGAPLLADLPEMENLIYRMKGIDMIVLPTRGRYKMLSGYVNTMSNVDYHSILIRIPGTNVWQQLTNGEYEILQALEKVTVTYSRVNKPRFFDKVFYSTDHTASGVENIIRLAVLIGLDLDYENILTRNHRFRRSKEISKSQMIRDSIFFGNDDEETYDSLTIDVVQDNVNANVTLTQAELGISDNPRVDKVQEMTNNQMNLTRNDFCMLNLIINVADLHRSMIMRKEYGERYYRY